MSSISKQQKKKMKMKEKKGKKKRRKKKRTRPAAHHWKSATLHGMAAVYCRHEFATFTSDDDNKNAHSRNC